MRDLIILTVLIVQVSASRPGALVIPGRNCGISQPYRHVSALPESQSDWQCLIVSDERLFREGYFDNKPSEQRKCISLGLCIRDVFL